MNNEREKNNNLEKLEEEQLYNISAGEGKHGGLIATAITSVWKYIAKIKNNTRRHITLSTYQ